MRRGPRLLGPEGVLRAIAIRRDRQRNPKHGVDRTIDIAKYPRGQSKTFRFRPNAHTWRLGSDGQLFSVPFLALVLSNCICST